MVNDLNFIGNVTKKPELRTIIKKNGEESNVTTVTIAVDRRRSGIPMDGTDFFDITVWGRIAENCVRYLEKGSKVHVNGYMVITTSEKDGQRRTYTQVTGKRVTFLSNRNNSNDSSSNYNNYSSTKNNTFEPIDSDDLPF